ncbi:hypothetical protein PVAP13_1NG040900 [Panicum virgatum]|uniref:Uncharacterized protein n=1 Tax=Panicum virgatum TaxID=38727 RepID=A0A8T0WU24_PANVG|nr:hypothetical protein PVAP13_1NG040900 [Panicum virgatum]
MKHIFDVRSKNMLAEVVLEGRRYAHAARLPLVPEVELSAEVVACRGGSCWPW